MAALLLRLQGPPPPPPLLPQGCAAGSELAFLREPGDVVATWERPLVLPCRVEGEPPVSISWQRDGLALANDSSAILILPSRAHEYHCVAQNCFGRLVSRRARVQLASLSRFHQHPESVEVEPGGVARFQCLIRGVPEPSVSWEHNGTTLSTASHRVTLLPRGILHITSVSRADVGTYRCVAHNVANTRHSQDAWLTLKGAGSAWYKEPEILSGPQNLTLTVHQTAVLECIATGHPQPLVSWSHLDGRSIGVEGIQVLGTGNLMISNVSVQHSGIYVCAANRLGTRVRRTAQGVLLVQAPPEFVQWPQSLSRPPGSSAVLTCVAQGVPEPWLAWLRNGKGLSPGDNIRLTHNSTLMLVGISAEDEAIYRCVAEDSASSNQASARLAVTGDPEPPPAPRCLQATALSTSAILVSWEPPPSNGDVTGYVLHLRPVGESKAGCSCSRDENSSLPGVVVGIHVGLAALIVCLLCLLLGWRHR
ncbi:immunoglobulin superfamily DCC subclass member 3-like [Balaenoptera acutorostrata]|uniref:immunoglobulin superfamily DCC subclass member 3-like n=1 Tax=Balaenoptera acutorostrata TaxID=9767 RepID=UPI00258D12A7|nr:immunoglobulin superfamily DCC subclass member 3-like [Balaenoptera acutorostrata]